MSSLVGGHYICASGNDPGGVASDCTFKDVLFRVDARLEFPRGTLLRYEHKNTVKERIKVLLVSFPSTVPPCVAQPPITNTLF